VRSVASIHFLLKFIANLQSAPKGAMSKCVESV